VIASKYAVAGVQTLVLVLTALMAALTDDVVTTAEWLQLAAVVVTGISVYVVKLLESGWAAAAKFIVALAGAGLSAAIPIVDTVAGGPGWSAGSVLIVVLAVANAALTAWGVDVRLDAVKEAIADPQISDRKVATLDPTAYRIVKTEVTGALP
jgi:hypothetical protein